VLGGVEDVAGAPLDVERGKSERERTSWAGGGQDLARRHPPSVGVPQQHPVVDREPGGARHEAGVGAGSTSVARLAPVRAFQPAGMP